jgi:hypothetical protein
MMTDYRYRFDDENEAASLLPDYQEAGQWRLAGDGFCLDPIGPLAPHDGWHLNLRVWDGRENPCLSHAVTPDEPEVVWMD